MKNLSLLLVGMVMLTLAGCGVSTPTTNEVVESTPEINSGELVENLPEDAIPFSGEFVSAGIGSETFAQTPFIEDLAISRSNEDSTSDHLFIEQRLLTNLGDEILPGNTLYFSGWVIWLEGAAGNHYYSVVGIDELKKVEGAERTQESINEQIEKWNYCEVDSDCASFYASCPFGCAKAVNVQYLDAAQQLIEGWRTKQGELGNPQCEYGCVAVDTARCGKDIGKCVITLPLSEGESAENGIPLAGAFTGCRIMSDNSIVCE